MNLQQFKEYAKEYSLIPVYEVITADLLTPVLAYLKIREKGKQNFLLESVEKSANMARYSFIGQNPIKIFSNEAYSITEQTNGSTDVYDKSIFEYIRAEIKKYRQPKIDGLPDFTGGIVGFLGYENISLIERVIEFDSHKQAKDEVFDNPDSIFGMYLLTIKQTWRPHSIQQKVNYLNFDLI